VLESRSGEVPEGDAQEIASELDDSFAEDTPGPLPEKRRPVFVVVNQ
jgi:hypothetical protein